MADAREELFLHLVTSGLDRAYAVAEKVNADRKSTLTIGVALALTPEQLEAADWTDVRTVQVEFAVIVSEKASKFTLSVADTAFVMERKLRLFIENFPRSA